MKRIEREHLLKDIFAGEQLADFRKASLELGLNTLRTRRTRRSVARAALLSSLGLALVGAAVWDSLPRLRAGRTYPPQSPSVTTAAAPSRTRTDQIKFISDEELMALFPDRAVALIGKPGNQQLVFPDTETPAPRSERTGRKTGV